MQGKGILSDRNGFPYSRRNSGRLRRPSIVKQLEKATLCQTGIFLSGFMAPRLTSRPSALALVAKKASHTRPEKFFSACRLAIHLFSLEERKMPFLSDRVH